jgi:hypothetical protein
MVQPAYDSRHLMLITSVVGLSIVPFIGLTVWTHSFNFLKFSKCERTNTLRAQLIFPSKPNFFAICLNFQQQNSLKNQSLPHLSSENCEINSIKSDSPRAFQQHQEHTQIPIQYSIFILFYFIFIEKMILMINSFHNIAPNTLQAKSVHPFSLRTFWRYLEHNMKCAIGW